MKRASLAVFCFAASGCASYWQAERLEEKVDRLLSNTNRETLGEIFGEQAGAIAQRMETLQDEDRQKLDTLVEGYQRGSTTLDEVRSSVVGVLGGATRMVSTTQGIWVRDESGKKLTTIGRDAKLEDCRKLEETELPDSIAKRKNLMSYSWGAAQLEGRTVLFPWELTMSSFTREIVENTAKRTAQELLRVSGERGWTRPVYIQVTTESPGQGVTISHPGADEIYVLPPQAPPAAPPAQE